MGSMYFIFFAFGILGKPLVFALNCDEGNSNIEALICSDVEIKKLSGEIDQEIKNQIKSKTPKAQSLGKDQVQWLLWRDKHLDCVDQKKPADCLRFAYKERLSEVREQKTFFNIKKLKDFGDYEIWSREEKYPAPIAITYPIFSNKFKGVKTLNKELAIPHSVCNYVAGGTNDFRSITEVLKLSPPWAALEERGKSLCSGLNHEFSIRKTRIVNLNTGGDENLDNKDILESKKGELSQKVFNAKKCKDKSFSEDDCVQDTCEYIESTEVKDLKFSFRFGFGQSKLALSATYSGDSATCEEQAWHTISNKELLGFFRHGSSSQKVTAAMRP